MIYGEHGEMWSHAGAFSNGARTVATLLAGGSDPVITAEPEGAFTHAVTDAALGN